jgi:nucleotide-binding universal stress UspA family protein
MADRRGIVVGFDGSECSEIALRWAASEARLRSTALHVLQGWQIGHVIARANSSGRWKGIVPPIDELQRMAQDDLERQVTSALEEPPAEVICRAVEEHPVSLLVRASATAELLVVGSRGRGPALGMLLGSVSQRCVNEASCPVVVIRS